MLGRFAFTSFFSSEEIESRLLAVFIPFVIMLLRCVLPNAFSMLHTDPSIIRKSKFLTRLIQGMFYITLIWDRSRLITSSRSTAIFCARTTHPRQGKNVACEEGVLIGLCFRARLSSKTITSRGKEWPPYL